jgi:hypothetical protein
MCMLSVSAAWNSSFSPRKLVIVSPGWRRPVQLHWMALTKQHPNADRGLSGVGMG